MSSAPSSPSVEKSILLAVEHQISAELLADRLRRAELSVMRVTDGHRASEVMEKERVGVAVAEARLAGRTGLELVRRRPVFDPPIVVLGRRGNDDEVVRALELGAADYITRPFSPRIATARIRRFLRLRRAAHNMVPAHDSSQS